MLACHPAEEVPPSSETVLRVALPEIALAKAQVLAGETDVLAALLITLDELVTSHNLDDRYKSLLHTIAESCLRN